MSIKSRESQSKDYPRSLKRKFPKTTHFVLSGLLVFVFFYDLRVASESLYSFSENELETPGHCPATDSNSRNNTLWAAKCLLPGRKIAGTQPVEEKDLIPYWTNHTLFAIGQRFATKNIGYLGIGHLFALIFENFIPDIKNVLLTTGSSYTVERAIKRYTATATQVLLWYRNSLQDPIERETLLRSIRTVRDLHLDGVFKVQNRLKGNSKTLLESKQKEIFYQLWTQRHSQPSVVFDELYWVALEKDLFSSNIPEEKRHFPNWDNITTPISQFAQALTQFSFVGLPVLFHKELGISHVSEEELRGYVHMWAALGHALGINDEFNICMNKNLEDSRKLFRDILDTYFIPAMFQFDWRVQVQLGSYLDALFHMDQVITPRLITFRFLRDFVKIFPYNIFRQMNLIERIYLSVIDGLLSTNLDANRFFVNRGGNFFLDANGYHYFRGNYGTDDRKSSATFYTRDEVIIH